MEVTTKVLILKKQLEFENHTLSTLNNEGLLNSVASRAKALNVNIAPKYTHRFITCHVSSWMLLKLTSNCSRINLRTSVIFCFSKCTTRFEAGRVTQLPVTPSNTLPVLLLFLVLISTLVLLVRKCELLHLCWSALSER